MLKVLTWIVMPGHNWCFNSLINLSHELQGWEMHIVNSSDHYNFPKVHVNYNWKSMEIYLALALHKMYIK